MEFISSYTCEDAIEGGSLHHVYPDKFPWLLVSPNVLVSCQVDGKLDNTKLIPLMMDAALFAAGPNGYRDLDDFPILLEHTVAGNVYVAPNEKNGLTIFTPDEY